MTWRDLSTHQSHINKRYYSSISSSLSHFYRFNRAMPWISKYFLVKLRHKFHGVVTSPLAIAAPSGVDREHPLRPSAFLHIFWIYLWCTCVHVTLCTQESVHKYFLDLSLIYMRTRNIMYTIKCPQITMLSTRKFTNVH